MWVHINKANLYEQFKRLPWVNDCLNWIHQGQDEDYSNWLHLAWRYENLKIFQYLSKVWQINLRSVDHEFRQVIEWGNKYGMTCLLYAVENMNYDLINYLIEECFCSIYCWNQLQQNVLHIAAMNRDIKTICIILWMDAEYNTLVKQKDSSGKTAVEYADKNWAILLNSKEFKEGNRILIYN